jgi:hypothetical protein
MGIRFTTKEYGPIVGYRVFYSTTVDHPELLADGYGARAAARPGQILKVPNEKTFGAHEKNRALAFFASVLTDPTWLSTSEYISYASILAIRARRSHADTIRKSVYFTRAERVEASRPHLNAAAYEELLHPGTRARSVACAACDKPIAGHPLTFQTGGTERHYHPAHAPARV